MKRHYKVIILSIFILLFTLIISSSTETRICTVCGVQDYETSIAGKTIEFLSQREYDEFNIHKKWQEKFGKKHTPHQWLLIEENTTDIIKLIDSL